MGLLDDIKARLDIVDTVSAYVPLQKAGRNYKALCPFHTEKTPSFIVNPERQSWHCFGACATGGDVFSFVMRMEKLDFGQTLRLLAQKAGVAIAPRGRSGQDELLYRINEAASRYYQHLLASSRGERANQYLDQRGVNGQMRSLFRLGLSLEGREELKAHLLDGGFSADQALEAGLLHRADDGTTRDFFWGRLMFPIFDRQGRTIGFGGRTLSGVEPKYLNTPGTAVFDKRGTLYALHLAVDSIRARNVGIVVEGYMDAIAAHQHGYTNVVASMGTALTEPQVSQLKALATNFVLALDPDAAGQQATLRSLETSWHALGRPEAGLRQSRVGAIYQRQPLVLRVAALPLGKDPDVLIRQDPKEWERLTNEAVPLLDYLLAAVAARYDLTTGEGKAQAAEALFPLVASVGNPFDQDRYFHKLAQVLGVSPATLEASVGRPRPRPWPGGRQPARAQPDRQAAALALSPDLRHSLDAYTLALLLHRPELRERARTFPSETFPRSEDRELFTRWLACHTIDELRQALDASLQSHLEQVSKIELEPGERGQSEAALLQCLWRLEVRYLQELQDGLLAEGGDATPPAELEAAVSTVNARLKELFLQGFGAASDRSLMTSERDHGATH